MPPFFASLAPSSPKERWFWPALSLLALLGLAWRLKVALHAPWYWDEGYVAELASALARGERPRLSGLWQDGFFPLSTSLLAPLSAAPFTLLPGIDAMTGVRAWACLLEAGSILWVGLLGRSLAGKPAGLGAALCYAMLPYAVEYGGRGFYHHFSIFFLLAALWWGLRLLESPTTRRLVATSLCAGLALASSYWLWWLPASLLCALALRAPRQLVLAAVLMGLPLLAVLGCSIAADPQGAWWSIRCLAYTSRVGAPKTLSLLAQGLGANLWHLPFLLTGALGLAWAAKERPRYLLLLACLGLAVFEPSRQRGAMWVLPYPFMATAPLAALGTGWLLWRLLRHGPSPAPLAAALACAAIFFLPHDVAHLERWSFSPAESQGLRDFLKRQAGPQDLICSLPSLNWSLRPGLSTCEVVDIGAADGYTADFYLKGIPASRFAADCRLQSVRYLVASRILSLGKAFSNGTGLTYLRAEKEGWPMVYGDRVFKVFENPRWNGHRDPAVRILPQAQDYYLSASYQAEFAGMPEHQRFALERMQGLPTVEGGP